MVDLKECEEVRVYLEKEFHPGEKPLRTQRRASTYLNGCEHTDNECYEE